MKDRPGRWLIANSIISHHNLLNILTINFLTAFEKSIRFSKLVASPELRSNFIQSTIRFLREHKFDGIDLDWEYPSYRDGSSQDDKDRYATLIKVRLASERIRSFFLSFFLSMCIR